jgi:hypothetical protein
MKANTTVRMLSQGQGRPMLMANQKAYLACDCTVWVGIRADNHETASLAWPCCPDHAPLMKRFNELLLDSLKNPQPVPLVDVCELLLEKAWG